MSISEVSLDEWMRFDHAKAVGVAEAAARQAGGVVRSVRRRLWGGRAAFNAVIEVGGEPFVLVPGGEARLGFDGAGWAPTDDEVLSYLGSYQALDPFPEYADVVEDDRDEARAEWAEGTVEEVRAHIDKLTSRPRTVPLKAFLAAPRAHEAGVRAAAFDHPTIVPLVDRWKPGLQALFGDFGLADDDTRTCGRVRFDTEGKPTAAWLVTHVTYEGVDAELACSGRRLPTPDEWEHAYALGARTLFPWGDRMPTRWMKQDEVFVTPDGIRLAGDEPGLSGLYMAQDSYKWELTADRREVRGADGGGAACGGEPWFGQWLLQASAYRDPEQSAFVSGRPHTRGTLVRPVIPLG
ncbi:SUMF1/EgtB/PvdO family nonheme iron enzyme [Streptomyces sp. NPDC048604]|uniref:SUMF1/EgtB/PvdO family nonheme iron enzyme n=1 Tax=Streptomyces sp. NPDC048604 TaxID=3365578 RepID=UPI00371E3652